MNDPTPATCVRTGPTVGAHSLPAAHSPLLRFEHAEQTARSPSPPPVAPHAFACSAVRRFSEPGYRSPTSATAFDAWAHPRRPDSRAITRKVVRCRTSLARPHLQRARLELLASPCEEDAARATSRNNPSDDRPRGAASTPDETPTETVAQPRRRLRTTTRPARRLRRRTLDDRAGLRGPKNPERRTFPVAPCCRSEHGRRCPSS